MGYSVLVVEGSALVRELLSRAVAGAVPEASITTCSSGRQALDRLASGRYDLITTSLLLPDMDGLFLCRHIRSSESHQLTPIVVISGDADGRLLREGFTAGVTDYFDKSQGYAAFGPFVRAFLQRHAGPHGRVLYVEDSNTVALVTRKMLERHQLQVTHVMSAEEGLQLLKEHPRNHFDLVITDLSLKGELSGGDLLHSLRTHLRYSQEELPVLVLTGNEAVQAQLEVFHAGANDFVTKPLVEEVFMARVRLLLTIKHQFDALREQTRTMQRMAVTDGLTGVYNRHYLLQEGLRFAQDRANQPVWVVIVDLDHFKQINDNYGHLTGDLVLSTVGQLLNERFSDGLVVRFGGEEFALLMPRSPEAQALERAEALRREIERLHPGGVPVTVSMGMACASHHAGADLDTLIGLADKALYAAKSSGRNRIFISDAQSEVVPFQAVVAH